MYCNIKGGEGRGNWRGRGKIGRVKGNQNCGYEKCGKGELRGREVKESNVP
jgi:hypothetical protein